MSATEEKGTSEEPFTIDDQHLPGLGFAPGEGVDAAVVKVGAEWVFLDVGDKGEGLLDRREVADVELQPGDPLRVWFVRGSDDGLLFSRKPAKGAAGKAMLQDALDNRTPLEGVVGAVTAGGFDVRLGDEVKVFCPFSQMPLRRADRPTDAIGQRLAFLVIEIAEEGRRVIVSRRALLEEEEQKARAALRERLQVGLTVPGTITRVKEFGVFVNLGGIEGLIPRSETGVARGEELGEAFPIGKSITVTVKSLDWSRNRISLSTLAAGEDPWLSVAAAFPDGSVHQGTVTRLAPFGAFVKLAEGIEGLAHISTLGGGKRIRHPRETIKEGQQIEVRVEKVEPDRRRISLAPADYEQTREGSSVIEEYRQKAAPTVGGFGSLGDILRASLAQKKGK
jgi:small subunit ribosomal protein S1